MVEKPAFEPAERQSRSESNAYQSNVYEQLDMRSHIQLARSSSEDTSSAHVPKLEIEDRLSAARTSVKEGNRDQLVESIGGDSPAAQQARQALKGDKQFQSDLVKSFGRFVPATELGTKPEFYSDPTNRLDPALRDTLRHGRVQLDSITGANAGYIFGNKQNTDLAIKSATPEERQRFKEDPEFAGNLQKAFEAAGNKSDVARWTRMMRTGEDKPTLADSLNEADTGSQSQTMRSSLKAVTGMSPEQARQYKDDPSIRQQVDASVAKLPPEARNLSEALLKQVSESGQPPVLDGKQQIEQSRLSGNVLSMNTVRDLLKDKNLAGSLSEADLRTIDSSIYQNMKTDPAGPRMQLSMARHLRQSMMANDGELSEQQRELLREPSAGKEGAESARSPEENQARYLQQRGGITFDGTDLTLERMAQLQKEGRNVDGLFSKALEQHKDSKERHTQIVLEGGITIATLGAGAPATMGTAALRITAAGMVNTAGMAATRGELDSGKLVGDFATGALAGSARPLKLLEKPAIVEGIPKGWPERLLQPKELPAVPEGHTRLYRGVQEGTGVEREFGRSATAAERDKFFSTTMADGYEYNKLSAQQKGEMQALLDKVNNPTHKFYTDEMAMAAKYAGDKGHVLYVDIPNNKIMEYMVPNGGMAALGHSGSTFQVPAEFHRSTAELVPKRR